jgi:hypothetical protein
LREREVEKRDDKNGKQYQNRPIPKTNSLLASTDENRFGDSIAPHHKNYTRRRSEPLSGSVRGTKKTSCQQWQEEEVKV